jgi:hypothetical protein
MTLRLYRVGDDQRRLLSALRRARDVESAPARSEIGAIEIELRELRIEERAATEIAVR